VLVVLAVELVLDPAAPVDDDVLDVVVGPPVVGEFESSEEQATRATSVPEPIAKVRSSFFTGFLLRQTVKRVEARETDLESRRANLNGAHCCRVSAQYATVLSLSHTVDRRLVGCLAVRHPAMSGSPRTRALILSALWASGWRGPREQTGAQPYSTFRAPSCAIYSSFSDARAEVSRDNDVELHRVSAVAVG